uniref:Endonuclease, NAD5 group I intron encoded n=1 Tax=Pichia sorbitophila (strain ATCC MYA-4447 / BCRC 22081 / CBS 7064 / NBRC 10061 / NRRL Y-12695) TaxID=559304 RepID=C7U023_PICSO|nr:endonuclease [Millerozyma farinosa]CAY39279.1 Endonuclease, NAD5 group I intron encoded [Millerozyma farinosa]
MTWLIYRYEEPMRMKFGTWFNMGEMEVNYGMMLDSLSMMVMVPVGIVTLCVLMYAMDYMRHDPNRNRFYIMLSVFAMFMTVLVVSENYLMMFIGWEFVGVVSYLLMSFWNTRMTAMKSGLSAITLNRMGDTFFVICLGILFNVYHAVDFETVELLTPHVNTNMLNMMALTLLLAATAKSAQLGLHGWLLSAMEGPTPVSALLHAATMVCSGVYVLVRSSFMLEYTPSMLLTMLWLGGITTLVSGLMAMVSNDIKKVMALSTMSQLARKYYMNMMFRNQTMCVEVLMNMFNINSQMTKAHNMFMLLYMYYINSNTFNSFSAMRQYFSFINTFDFMFMSEKWKIIIMSKLVGISEAMRLMFINFSYLFMHNFIYPYSLIYSSSFNYDYKKEEEDILNKENLISNEYEEEGNHNNVSSDPFHEWLAGLIDGDGYFNLSKKGTARLIITMDIKDKKSLYDIKNKFGGSMYMIANANALKYQMSHKKGLMTLMNAINGNMRNPKRMLQMNKLCNKYNIKLLFPKPLTYNNGWFSGMMDSDGSTYMNENNEQMFLSVTQKDKYILEPLIKMYSGRIRTISPKIEAFRYDMYRKNELFNLIDNYFNKYPLRSSKSKRLNLIKEFYLLRPYKDSKDMVLLNKWLLFKDKWDKYKD